MKIKEEIKQKSFRCYDEALGVAISKKYILKRKRKNILTYTEQFFLLFLLFFFLSIVFLYVDLPKITAEALCLLASLCICMIFVRSVMFFLRGRKIFTTLIHEEGITDESFYELKILIPWDKVLAVVVKKHSVTILTSTPILLYFDNSMQERIIKAVQKYKKDILIIS